MYIDKETPTPSISIRYINTADLEGLAELSGLVATGIKAVKDNINKVMDSLTVKEKTPHGSGFISEMRAKRKDKKFNEYYNVEIGIPIGFTGKVSDAADTIKTNIKHINLLDTYIDKVTDRLSVLVNTDEKESFASDKTLLNGITSNNSSLHKELINFIDVKSRVDVATLGSIFYNNNDIDRTLEIMKQVDKEVDYSKLEQIKAKLKYIDVLVSAMVSSETKYSKPIIQELGLTLDGISAYTNGIATLVYLKVSVNDILDSVNDVL